MTWHTMPYGKRSYAIDGMSSRLDSGSRQYAWLPAMMCVHCRLIVAKAANNMHEKYVYKSRVKMGVDISKYYDLYINI